MSHLAPTLEAFFTVRLVNQRHASVNTVAAYRDAKQQADMVVRAQRIVSSSLYPAYHRAIDGLATENIAVNAISAM